MNENLFGKSTIKFKRLRFCQSATNKSCGPYQDDKSRVGEKNFLHNKKLV